ncbi:UDP-2,4-diacetamido-2,4,6-trideoxy-beta-L-altropyranose hydrolase [Pectobacterium brasiliense]|uniref:UDP-2,4-diacetamido-2,4, 6-trideoxy-beta-L-altropyranose hydrolase n=1 Tax=Pectobacterium brasiliense TaxID=180957 RepID=UPI001F23F392|nr:UDP-2,4-diacetamido-2,4,6-trideoxy-beta-L-altropyranose hydrolase [Pectobacterium brasiliense]
MAKYLFRADASIDIGSGHIMRCMTLANELRRSGHDIYFICRDLPGHLAAVLEKSDIAYSLLGPPNDAEKNLQEPVYVHSAWLTVSQETDFLQSKKIIASYQPDWIVVDHYALSVVWQEKAREFGAKICIIDDLADRPHQADVLIDQNLGRKKGDYYSLVPSYCQLLIGPQYALLRPEFKLWREASLKRRSEIKNVQHILVNLGGVDKDNITEKILSALANVNVFDKSVSITVVMGETAPHLHRIIKKSAQMPYKTQVLCGVDNMAELMTHADLAIGAAGSTSWERCCLGLPTVQIVIAKNQRSVAKILSEQNMAFLVSSLPSLNDELNFIFNKIKKEKKIYYQISYSSQSITDGDGCSKVLAFLDGGRSG